MRHFPTVLLATLLAAHVAQGSARTVPYRPVSAEAPDTLMVTADTAGSFAIVTISSPDEQPVAEQDAQQERASGRYIGGNVAFDAALLGRPGKSPEMVP